MIEEIFILLRVEGGHLRYLTEIQALLRGADGDLLPRQPAGGQADPSVQVVPFSGSFLVWRGLRYQVERIAESIQLDGHYFSYCSDTVLSDLSFQLARQRT